MRAKKILNNLNEGKGGNRPLWPRIILAICTALALVCWFVPQALASDQPQVPKMPSLLPLSQQIKVRESWLPKRYEVLLQAMRRLGIQMWIVVNEEFHPDPATEYIAPPHPYAGGRDFFVFIDTGSQGLKRVAITGYAEENVRLFFEAPEDPQPAAKVLPELYATYKPEKIALNIGGPRGVTRSLTHDSYLLLSKELGEETSQRFTSAAELIEELFDTRFPEEKEHYSTLVQATDILMRRALSNEVITPGKTTVGDIRNWLYDQAYHLKLQPWFQPDLRVWSKGIEGKQSRGFTAVAEEKTVIQPGMLVHLDFGMSYMGMSSDMQRMSYVLLPGETDASPGLKKALANTNALQDALMIRAARPGLTSGEVTQKAMDEVAGKGFEPRVYCHAIGFQGHGLGTGLGYGFAAGSKGDPSKMTKRLRNGSYITIELNTVTPLPEWDGQLVYVCEEDDAYLTDQGYKFFVPRQEKWYLIKSD